MTPPANRSCRYLLLSVLALALPASSLAQKDLSALDGEWVYVEDRTPGRSLERLGPPMSSTFSMKTAAGAVILVSGHGGGSQNVRVALDGSPTEVKGTESTTKYTGEWKGGSFTYRTTSIRDSDGRAAPPILREFRPTSEGLIVRVVIGSPVMAESVALYKHPQDIAMPTPVKATIADLGWLAGAWTGTRGNAGTTTIEERWSPPQGGAMLATSRTVSGGKMTAFEFLRIVEKDGGLVYIAQPNGGAATEFVLTEFSATRALFDNPRHDYPKRIVYELSPEGALSATIGFLKGGTPRRFEFRRAG